MTIHELKPPRCNDPDIILDAAKGMVSQVIIIGETEYGEPYYASTTSHKPTLLWMIERLKHLLVEGEYDE